MSRIARTAGAAGTNHRVLHEDPLERQLIRVVADRLSLGRSLGYDLTEPSPVPEHSSLSRIRERYSVKVFPSFFEHSVDLRQHETSAEISAGSVILAEEWHSTKTAGTDLSARS